MYLFSIYLFSFFSFKNLYENNKNTNNKLNHPNIVKYYESFIDNESLCISMEYVEGFNLSELIKLQIEKGN